MTETLIDSIIRHEGFTSHLKLDSKDVANVLVEEYDPEEDRTPGV